MTCCRYLLWGWDAGGGGAGNAPRRPLAPLPSGVCHPCSGAFCLPKQCDGTSAESIENAVVMVSAKDGTVGIGKKRGHHPRVPVPGEPDEGCVTIDRCTPRARTVNTPLTRDFVHATAFIIGFLEAEADTVHPMRPIAVERASHPITCDALSLGHLQTPWNEGDALVSPWHGSTRPKNLTERNGRDGE